MRYQFLGFLQCSRDYDTPPTGRPSFILAFCLLILTSFSLTGCQRHIRSIKYSAYEKVGVDKRDLVRRRVQDVKEDHEEVREEFKDALERLQEVVQFDGGDLERQYRKLQSAQEGAVEEANEVRSSIEALETVAQDLFREWEREITEISSSSLKIESRRILDRTKQRYSRMHRQLKRSEAKLEPVLTQLNDQVLFLKHNLNAQAVTALKAESWKIEERIKQLIEDINRSINESEAFMAKLPQS